MFVFPSSYPYHGRVVSPVVKTFVHVAVFSIRFFLGHWSTLILHPFVGLT